jgi:hypothetical protein
LSDIVVSKRQSLSFNSDEGLSWLAFGQELGEIVDESDVVGLLGGLLAVSAAARGDLGDGQADYEQSDLGLEVGPIGDVERLVRLGEEKVEPGCSRQRC